MKKRSKPIIRNSSSLTAISFNRDWSDPHDSNTTRGVSANAAGVGLWHQDHAQPDGGIGRQFGWEEWYEFGSLPSGAPDATQDAINEVARALNIKTPKRPKARAVTRREDLGFVEPSPEEARLMRLRRLFGDDA